MRSSIRSVLVVAALSLLVPALAAADKRFAIRFGLVGLEPTADSTILGQRTELDRAAGGEFDFEWYISSRLGLEGSVATLVDADVEQEQNTVAGVTLTPITVGLNAHVVRNDSLDWYFGVVAGRMFYSDFEVVNNSGTATRDDDTIWGLQTALDIGVGESWGINVGVKYLEASLTTTRRGVSRDIEINPIMLRVMGVFRW